MLKVALPPPDFACVVAADNARGIGKDNQLPWRGLKTDVQHFKDVTTQTDDAAKRNAVIMGRRTWDSLPPKWRPLPDRFNVVVSRAAPELPLGVALAATLDDAIAAAAATPDVESIFVVGGAQIYTAAVADPRCKVIYYTRVYGSFHCDAHFPEFEHAFHRVAHSSAFGDAAVEYRIERWHRNA